MGEMPILRDKAMAVKVMLIQGILE